MGTRAVIDLDEYRLKKGLQLPFGQAVAALRNIRGITQQDLVKTVEPKMDRSFLSKQENGKLKVSPENAVAVTKALAAPALLVSYCAECPVKQYLESLKPKPAA